MTEVLSDLSPKSLAAASKASLLAYFHRLRDSPQATVHEGPYQFRWTTPVPHPWFNGIICSQPPMQNANQLVEETLAYFRSKHVPSFSWWLSPEVEPTAWAKHLSPYGFQYADQTPGMAIDLADLPPLPQSPLSIRPIEDQRALNEWVQTFIRGYEIPEEMAPAFMELYSSLGFTLPLRQYTGYLDGEPVATSALFTGSGVAGIYNVGTIPTARGKGVGSAMTLVPLYEARTMGYRAGVLQSSEMGYSVYQRLGFRELCKIDHFYWKADESLRPQE